MADNRPWSVKGIDPETREAAKIAARRAGLTLGAWLSRTIRSHAASELKRGGTGEAAPELAGNAAAGGANLPAPSLESLLATMQRLRERLDAAEDRASDSVAPIARRIDDVARQLHGLKSRSAESVTLVEQALISLNERLRRLERGRNAADGSVPDIEAPVAEGPTATDHDAPAGRISRLFNRDE